jgi:hypothetical protein
MVKAGDPSPAEIEGRATKATMTPPFSVIGNDGL